MSSPFFPAAVFLALAQLAASAEPSGQQPFSVLRDRQTEYVGPGRDEPPPTELSAVPIGYFGPGDPQHAQYGDLWQAAVAAVEIANGQGGYRGLPFRLVAAWSDDPWGAGVKELVRLVYEERVWAVIGGVDGDTTHLAEQVALKSRVALVSPISTDKTVNLANVPWMFSLAPGDHLLAPVLADEILACAGPDDFVLVTSDNHDARALTTELRAALRARQGAPRFQHTCRPAEPHAGALFAEILKQPPKAVIIIADAADSAHLLRELRSQRYGGQVFGGPSFGRRTFLQHAGPAAVHAVFPLLHAAGPSSARRLPASVPCDYATAHTFDAVSLTIAAIRSAGLNRVRIQDAIRALDGWTGLTGPVHWDKLGSNTRPVRLGVISDPDGSNVFLTKDSR